MKVMWAHCSWSIVHLAAVVKVVKLLPEVVEDLSVASHVCRQDQNDHVASHLGQHREHLTRIFRHNLWHLIANICLSSVHLTEADCTIFICWWSTVDVTVNFTSIYIQELLPLSALLKVWFPPSQLIPNSQLDPPSQLAPILPNIFHKQVSTECFQFCIEYFPPLFHPKQKLFIKKFKIRY